MVMTKSEKISSTGLDYSMTVFITVARQHRHGHDFVDNECYQHLSYGHDVVLELLNSSSYCHIIRMLGAFSGTSS